MKSALFGLLQSGKSTIFSTISGKGIPAIGSTTIEEAMVSVPDERLEWLSELYKPKKVTHATIDCLDVPGLNFTDEHGRAAARRLINQIRTVDLLVLVVRAFEDASVPAYKGGVDAIRDVEELKTELLLWDLELVSTRVEHLETNLKKPGKGHAQEKAELELYKKLQDNLEQEKPISKAIAGDEEHEIVKSLGFLTLKPMILVVNTGEEGAGDELVPVDTAEGIRETLYLCAKLEYELAQLEAESRGEFMSELGIEEPAIDKFVHTCYSALGLISFLTVVSAGELRAWPIRKGTTALDAAGKVHTDIKRGFIRAETIAFDDLKELGSEKAVKAAGKTRLEGKDYIVKDGDIINFRFNV